jgi:hypothetical protein
MLSLTIKMTPSHPAAEFEKFEKWFPGQLQAAHMGLVLRILERCAMWSRRDTGRFQGGWIGMARAVGYPIDRSMGTPKDPSAQAEGIAMSTVTNDYLSTTVTNGVEYGGYLEDTAGIFDQSGTQAYVASPYRGLMDSIILFQFEYARKMEEALKVMGEKMMNAPNDSPPWIDFGPPDPSGATE